MSLDNASASRVGFNYIRASALGGYKMRFVASIHKDKFSTYSIWEREFRSNLRITHNMDRWVMPLGLEYSFLPGKVQPYIRGTFDFLFLSDPEYKVQEVGGSVINQDKSTGPIGKLGISLGCKYYIGERDYLNLMFNYTQGEKYDPYYELEKFSIIYINLGYGFKLYSK